MFQHNTFCFVAIFLWQNDQTVSITNQNNSFSDNRAEYAGGAIFWEDLSAVGFSLPCDACQGNTAKYGNDYATGKLNRVEHSLVYNIDSETKIELRQNVGVIK